MVASYVFGFMLCFDLVFEGPNVRIITNENENENSVEKGEIKPDSQNGIIKGKDHYINFKENNTTSEIKNVDNADFKEQIINSNIKEINNNSGIDSNKKKLKCI